MAKSTGQKLKLLYLRDYLLRYSDEDHPVSVSDMIAFLAQHGISAERKSLYDDIDALREYGLDIQTVKHKSTGYFVADRDFQLPEVKLLVDAVQSSRFITHSKTLSLIGKIESLASIHEGRTLHRQVVVQNRVKSMNESVYYNVDLISEAITLGVRLRFRYFEYDRSKERRYRRGGDEYSVSPAFMVWDDENYYLVARPDDTGDTRHYRIDKMTRITVTDQPAVHTGIDPAEYTNTLFGMYAGERRSVRLRFADSMAGVVIDRFGKDAILIPDGADHFTVRVDVSVSPQFLAWVFGLGANAEILDPPDVRARMQAHLAEIQKIYEE